MKKANLTTEDLLLIAQTAQDYLVTFEQIGENFVVPALEDLVVYVAKQHFHVAAGIKLALHIFRNEKNLEPLLECDLQDYNPLIAKYQGVPQPDLTNFKNN